MALTGSVIKAALEELEDPDDFANALARAIVENLEITIPPGQVVVSAASIAVPVPNPAPLRCDVK